MFKCCFNSYAHHLLSSLSPALAPKVKVETCIKLTDQVIPSFGGCRLWKFCVVLLPQNYIRCCVRLCRNFASK